MNEDDLTPRPKVIAGAIGAAVASVLVGVAVWLGASQPPAGLEGGLAGVVGFLFGYFKVDTGDEPDDGGQTWINQLIGVVCLILVLVFAYWLVSALLGSAPR